MLRAIAIAVFALVVANSAAAQAPERGPVHVLFIGNSYTSFNNLPKQIADLARAGKQRLLRWESVTPGGFTLAQHLENAETTRKIASRKWRCIIVQEQSQLPFLAREQMHAAARALHEKMEPQTERTIFYATWARREQPEKQEAITSAYETIAAELEAELAPVGKAWTAALANENLPALYAADGSHPTPAGTYLAACVFYAVIYDQNPVGLAVHPNGITPEQARKLQEIAWETVQRMKDENS